MRSRVCRKTTCSSLRRARRGSPGATAGPSMSTAWPLARPRGGYCDPRSGHRGLSRSTGRRALRRFADMDFDYRRLDGFTYHIASAPTAYLRQWLSAEWRVDAGEYPDQPWTREWLGDLARLQFRLDIVELAAVRPRQDLM